MGFDGVPDDMLAVQVVEVSPTRKIQLYLASARDCRLSLQLTTDLDDLITCKHSFTSHIRFIECPLQAR
jgi:hypothetical protein